MSIDYKKIIFVTTISRGLSVLMFACECPSTKGHATCRLQKN
jgi:hypothetical protein